MMGLTTEREGLGTGNGEQRRPRTVEQEHGAAQSVDDGKKVEGDHACHKGNGDVSPITDRLRRQEPIMRSRVIPPKFPATNARTRTPNKSSRRLSAAPAPLSAKTKVPRRSSTNRSVSIVAATFDTTRSVIDCKPGGYAAANHACAATINVVTPVSRVGRITGANRGLWLTGISLIRPSCSAFALHFRCSAIASTCFTANLMSSLPRLRPAAWKSR